MLPPAPFTLQFKFLRELGSRLIPFTVPTQFWEGYLHKGRCSGQELTLRVAVRVDKATLALQGFIASGGRLISKGIINSRLRWMLWKVCTKCIGTLGRF